MRVAVDIDGTIAGRNLQYFKKACNEQFGLGIESDRLYQLGYYAFMQSAEIVLVQQHLGQEQFAMSIERIEQDPAMMSCAPVLPDAVECLCQLAYHASISYYTVRKHNDSNTLSQIQRATKQWLTDCCFPNAESVYFCRSSLAKVTRLYENEQSNKDCFMLIDDRWNMIIQDFPHLYENGYGAIADAIKDRLVLVAFGAANIPDITNGLQVVALPSWSHIIDIYPTLFV